MYEMLSVYFNTFDLTVSLLCDVTTTLYQQIVYTFVHNHISAQCTMKRVYVAPPKATVQLLENRSSAIDQGIVSTVCLPPPYLALTFNTNVPNLFAYHTHNLSSSNTTMIECFATYVRCICFFFGVILFGETIFPRKVISSQTSVYTLTREKDKHFQCVWHSNHSNVWVVRSLCLH